MLTVQAAERHAMRFIFAKELEIGCEFARMNLGHLFALPGCEQEPTVDDRNALLAGPFQGCLAGKLLSEHMRVVAQRPKSDCSSLASRLPPPRDETAK